MRYALLSLLVFTIFSCEDKDNEPPQSTIISPSANSTVNEIVNITCMATDNKGIEKVELWIDGENTLLVDETEPYSIKWNTTTYKDGSYTLVIRSYDVNGNKGDSPAIKVNVDNTLSIPNPININEVSYDFSKMKVSWETSSDGDFSKYVLLYSEKEDGNKEIIETYNDRATTSHFKDSFDPTIENWFWIEVHDTLGYSVIGTGKTNTIDKIPDKVNILSIEYDLNNMVIDWEKSNETDFAFYDLLYSDTETGEKTILTMIFDANVTTHLITDFDPTKERWYWIETHDFWTQTNLSDGYKVLDDPPTKSDFRPIIYIRIIHFQ